MIASQFLKRSYAVVLQPHIICRSLHFGDPHSPSCLLILLLFPLNRHMNGNANEPAAEQRQTNECLPVDRDPAANEPATNVRFASLITILVRARRAASISRRAAPVDWSAGLVTTARSARGDSAAVNARSIAYWITWVACIRTDCGMVRPRARAVFRLTNRSNCVGCSIGRSAGLTPFRILSTWVAARRYESTRFSPSDSSPPTSTNSLISIIVGSR